MSTLNAYYRKHGRDGMRRLAEKADIRFGYLQQLNYVPSKRPSEALARRLVEASGGEITLEGLANPEKILRFPRRDRRDREGMDAQIKELYSRRVRHGEVKAFAQRFGVTRQHVFARARAIGIDRPQMKRWSNAEIALLLQHDETPLDELEQLFRAAGYARSRGSLAVRRTHEAKLPLVSSIAYYMGVDVATVRGWIERHGLPEQDGRVRREDLVAWLYASRDWDHRLCNRAWLVRTLGTRVNDG